MAVPSTSISKKRIRKNIWKRKGYGSALKALSLGKSLSTGNSKSFFLRATNIKSNMVIYNIEYIFLIEN
uniref:Ribosomal protein L32 n=2 Tax=Lophira TaxID=549774 RepID=A0A8F3IU38_9ROSI|nr:ribosomal protein L32 [Lophira alata]QWY89176.1 ribosomal protein L32 [Lophira lanceolata]